MSYHTIILKPLPLKISSVEKDSKWRLFLSSWPRYRVASPTACCFFFNRFSRLYWNINFSTDYGSLFVHPDLFGANIEKMT